MPVLEIDKLYNPNIKSWPEIPEYNFRGGAHELLLFYGAPDEKEIDSVKSGLAHFAFTVEEGIIFFLYRFEPGLPWGDAAFSIHLVPEEQRILPPELETPESRYIIQVHLIDAKTGILKAMRVVTFSPEFTRKLHAAIRAQAGQLFSEQAHRTIVPQIYQRFTTKQLLDRAIARTKGGV